MNFIERLQQEYDPSEAVWMERIIELYVNQRHQAAHILQSIQDCIETRIQSLEEELKASKPDWYDPHDYASGLYDGRKASVRKELQFLRSIRSEISDP